nr:DUF3489 domain-containing protein [Sphingomonas sp. CDS-1]
MNSLVRLTDIQLVLLATAAQRDNGSLLPPPDTLGEGPARIRKAVESLIRRGLAEEVAIRSSADAWRKEGRKSIGVVITDAGRAAIAVEPEEQEAADQPASQTAHATDAAPSVITSDPQPSPATDAEPSAPATGTKTALVIDLLRRTSGATLDELADATSWLPHTTRAALTGLRKRGYAIEKRKRGEVSCYHLEGQA